MLPEVQYGDAIPVVAYSYISCCGTGREEIPTTLSMFGWTAYLMALTPMFHDVPVYRKYK